MDEDSTSTAESLDVFAETLFNSNEGQSDVTPEKEESPKQEEVLDPTREDSPAEELKEETKVDEPKLSRFQERINELTKDKKQAQREADELRQRIAELERKPSTSQPSEISDKSSEEPNPMDLTESGEAKYPLGEFDPSYIADLTKYIFKQEKEAFDKEENARLEQEKFLKERQQVEADWSQSLASAKERYPDFIEKGENLSDLFDGVDENYADYLTSTLMSMEHGTDVLYYLANNPDEAYDIVRSGSVKATIRLGRLQAKFEDMSNTSKQEPKVKTTKAPEPPPVNKGSAKAGPDDSDPDDLDSFAKLLFKK